MGRIDQLVGPVKWDGILEPGTVRHHSSHDSPEYRSWMDMRKKCWNKNHKKYPQFGGQGIRPSKQWNACFLTFLDEMGKKPPGMRLILREGFKEYNKDTCSWEKPKKVKK